MNVDRKKWFQVGSYLQNLFSDTQRGVIYCLYTHKRSVHPPYHNKSEKQPIPLSVERVWSYNKAQADSSLPSPYPSRVRKWVQPHNSLSVPKGCSHNPDRWRIFSAPSLSIRTRWASIISSCSHRAIARYDILEDKHCLFNGQFLQTGVELL